MLQHPPAIQGVATPTTYINLRVADVKLQCDEGTSCTGTILDGTNQTLGQADGPTPPKYMDTKLLSEEAKSYWSTRGRHVKGTMLCFPAIRSRRGPSSPQPP
jgi:hypothetical protein